MIERIRFSYEIIEISRLKNTLWMRIRLWLKRICLDMIVRERTFDSKKDVLVCNESKQDVETSALTEWKNAICVRETFNRYTFFLDIIRDTCGLILFWWRNYVEKLKSRKVGRWFASEIKFSGKIDRRSGLMDLRQRDWTLSTNWKVFIIPNLELKFTNKHN